MKITFFGGVETVTGSKYLIEHKDTKILVDCGLFQGPRKLRERNWDTLPVDPSSIDAVVLTHAHVDHTGYIPVLIKNGFRGKVYCSKATYALVAILLVDSGFIHEEDAKKANKYGYSRHKPALPLYTVKEAERSLKFFQTVDFDTAFTIGASLTVKLIRAGHILGASFVIVSDGKRTITFSGDLGRPGQLIMKPPTALKQTDYLIIESTYGDRLHDKDNPIKELEQIVKRIVAKKGVLIIPAFAIGRTQAILYILYQLKQKKVIPDIPIFLDSPMAISVTDLFCKFKDEHKLSPDVCEDVFGIAAYTRSVQESKKIDRATPPFIVIAGSGMADGGRVADHFKHFISDAKNTIAFVGFQGKGTRGRFLIEGAQEVKIHGKVYKVRAKIKMIDTVSAHSDYNEILDWLANFENKPRKVFVTHGETKATQALKEKIEKRFGWSVVDPKYLDSFDLD